MNLASVVSRIQTDFGLTPVVAVELEFYLHGAASFAGDLCAELKQALWDAALPALKVEKEKGYEQYEVALAPLKDPVAAAEDAAELKEAVTAWSAKRNIRADFSAKPFVDQPGSGMHIHVHLEDAQGSNVFFREGEHYSESLLHAVGGLLALMPEHMIYFAPHERSRLRFVEKSDAPLTVSWGPNNRTVAIRLPAAPMEHKHLEHRVAGADADPYQVIAAVLAGIHHGLSHRIDPGPAIHGDASDAQYGLKKLLQGE